MLDQTHAKRWMARMLLVVGATLAWSLVDLFQEESHMTSFSTAAGDVGEIKIKETTNLSRSGSNAAGKDSRLKRIYNHTFRNRSSSSDNSEIGASRGYPPETAAPSFHATEPPTNPNEKITSSSLLLNHILNRTASGGSKSSSDNREIGASRGFSPATATPSFHATSTSTDPPTSLKEKTNSSPLLFLEHASHGGWSNQVHCLESAYYLARATGRILVTSPVLPHWTPVGSGLWKDGKRFLPGHRISTNFQLDYRLQDTYLNRKYSYIRMEKVFDVDYTFPHVTTMDYRDFRQRFYQPPASTRTNLTHWVLESQFHHGNTIWTIPDPVPANFQWPYRAGHGRQRRNASSITEANTTQQPSQLWTFLDTFYAKMDTNLTRHPIRYALPIRRTAHKIHQTVWQNYSWYSAIHLRVGDGFKGRAEETTARVVEQHTRQTADWMADTRRQGIARRSPVGRVDRIGIFLATDLPPTDQSEFRSRLRTSLTTMAAQQNQSQLTFDLLDSASFAHYTAELKPSLEYPEIFLDQQLAACAPLVFTGSPGSSFSRLIHSLRNSPGACDVE